jgi:hypothetical protein
MGVAASRQHENGAGGESNCKNKCSRAWNYGSIRDHENVLSVAESVVFSQVSESKPGAPMVVLLDEFSGQSGMERSFHTK